MDLNSIKEIISKVSSGGDAKSIITDLIENYGKDNVSDIISNLINSDLLKDKDYLTNGISAEDLTSTGLKVAEDIKNGDFSLDSIQGLVGDALQDKAGDILKDKLGDGLGGLLGK